jgi:hypothetical protein
VAPPPHPPGFDPHTGHDHSPGHWGHDLSAHDHSDHQH